MGTLLFGGSPSSPTAFVNDLAVIYWCETDKAWYGRVGYTRSNCHHKVHIQDGHYHCHYADRKLSPDEAEKIMTIIAIGDINAR